MATATYTCTTFMNTPKAVHVGDQSVSGNVVWTATSTVGDIAFLAKIPHGATIVDFIEYHTTGATAQALSFGLGSGAAAGGGANLSVLVSSGAQATMNRFSFANTLGKAPQVVSVSDLDTQRYAILQAKVESGSTTTSLKVSFIINYRMDGPTPV